MDIGMCKEEFCAQTGHHGLVTWSKGDLHRKMKGKKRNHIIEIFFGNNCKSLGLSRYGIGVDKPKA
jgi:hypothetical protein